MMNTTVLVALDYSETDERLVQKAMELAKGGEVSIILLHVFSFFDAIPAPAADSLEQGEKSPDSLSSSSLQTWEGLEKTSLSKLQTYVQQFEQVGILVNSHHVLGHPGPVICKLARKLEVDTIIMGRSGRRGLTEAVLGSVSNYVFHHAPCSVWVISGG